MRPEDARAALALIDGARRRESLAADLDAERARRAASVDGAGPELRLVPLADFAAAVEPSAEALLGTDDDAPFTAGGTVITYGDGGQGKTTLAIDGLAHLAAGVPWLGLAVPRPLRIVVIENEGPRGRFRRKFRRKLETWTGPPFAPNVLALEEPWGGFTFADEALRSRLASACTEFDADALVIGPLVTLGPEGGGTPEEVARFEALLARFRAELARPLLVWFAHHENKAGDVSGAWERMPDTLMHVRLEGRAQTKVHWRKVRWSSALHDERWTLRWLEDSEGFELVDEPERDVRAEIVALWDDDPEQWRTATEVADKREGGIGRHRKDVQRELKALVDEGEFEHEKGPPGRHPTAACYRPAEVGRASRQASQPTLPVASVELGRPTPVREGGPSRTTEQPPPWPRPSQEGEEHVEERWK